MVKRYLYITFNKNDDSQRIIGDITKIFRNATLEMGDDYISFEIKIDRHITSYDLCYFIFKDAYKTPLRCRLVEIKDEEELDGYEEIFTINDGELKVTDFKYLNSEKIKEMLNLKKQIWRGFDELLNNHNVVIGYTDTSILYDLCKNYMWEDGFYQEKIQNEVLSFISEYINNLRFRADKIINLLSESNLKMYVNENIEYEIKKRVFNFPYLIKDYAYL